MSKHMQIEDRISIAEGLRNGLSFTAIVLHIGKATVSVSREVRNHRIVSTKSGYSRMPNCGIRRRYVVDSSLG